MPETAPVSDGTMPCPVPSPGGLPCTKRIPKGMTADEGHGGGHWWISPELDEVMSTGHFDATHALAAFEIKQHQPEDCIPSCPRYWERGVSVTPDEDVIVADPHSGTGLDTWEW